MSEVSDNSVIWEENGDDCSQVMNGNRVEANSPDQMNGNDENLMTGGESRQESESAILAENRAKGVVSPLRDSAKLARRALAQSWGMSQSQKAEIIESAHSIFTDPAMPHGIRLGMGKLLMEANRQSLLAVEIAGRLSPAPAGGQSRGSAVNLTLNIGSMTPEQKRILADADRVIDITPDSSR